MKYERVLLIHPAYPGTVAPIPNWPLGLGYIAEALKSAGINYKIIDMRFNYGKDFLFRTVKEFKPDLIGLSLMTSKYKYHYALIRELRNSFENIPIVVGGPHISTLREKVLIDCPEIDYGVVGEGEATVVELCKGVSPDNIKGLLYRQVSSILSTGSRIRIVDLDSIPFPKWNGFEMDKYDTKSINILSSRGCPHQCIYCCVKVVIGRQWIARSAKNVADEIEYWYGKGYRVFNFSDDAFNILRKRVLEICDEIEKRGLKIELNAPNGMRADRADRELLSRMKEAGFRHVAFGVEGGNNKVLSNIKKGETIEEIEEAIKNACDLGYEVALFFLIGSPGETEKDVEDSFQLANRYPIVDVRFYNLIPFPNTELYHWIEKNNYFILQPEEYLNGNMMWVNKPILHTPELDIQQRKKIYERGLKLGNRLRRQYIFNYYQRGFKKFGIFATSLAYIAASDIFQCLLGKIKVLQTLRIMLKKRHIFSRV